jgi:hypothetical protein
MHGRAYLLSYTYETSQKKVGVFHALKERIRAQFSREKKPIDHLGGTCFEDRLLVRVDYVKFNHPFINDNRDLEIWPKKGTSHENMEICIG